MGKSAAVILAVAVGISVGTASFFAGVRYGKKALVDELAGHFTKAAEDIGREMGQLFPE